MKRRQTEIGELASCASELTTHQWYHHSQPQPRKTVIKHNGYLDQAFFTFSVDFPLEMFMEHLRVFHPGELPHISCLDALYPNELGLDSASLDAMVIQN